MGSTNNNALVCQDMQYSVNNFFVHASLNVAVGAACTGTESFWSSEAIALYACSTTVPTNVTSSTNGANVKSWDQSCTASAGRAQVQFNYYNDTNCNVLLYSETDTTYSRNEETCQSIPIEGTGGIYFVNSYCVSDGNYQQYNPPAPYITTQSFKGDGCDASDTMLTYESEATDVCFPVNGASISYETKTGNYSGYYKTFQYSDTSCTQDETAVQGFDYTGACSPVYGEECPSPNANLQYYDINSIVTNYVAAPNNDAQVCQDMQYSDQNFFVQASLRVGVGAACTGTESFFSSEAIALYACSTTVPTNVTSSTNGANVKSWDQSCTASAGRAQVQFNYYNDTNCNVLLYSETDTTYSRNEETCQSIPIEGTGGIYFVNSYCVSDGNYQQYNPPAPYITTQSFKGDGCDASDTMLTYESEATDVCFPVNGASQSYKTKIGDYSGYYETFQYSDTSCTQNETAVESFDYTGVCAPVLDEECPYPNANLQYYDINSVLTNYTAAPNNDAQVCQEMQYSDQNFLVQTTLNIDFSSGETCETPPAATPPIYASRAIALYSCSTTVPTNVTSSTNGAGVMSWDQSCTSIAGRAQVQFNYYSDVECKVLLYSETDTTYSENLEYCQPMNDEDVPGASYFVNTYCVSDGNYQQYNPPGSYVTQTTYGGSGCTGTVLYHDAQTIDSCFQLTGSTPINYFLTDSDYNGYYTTYSYTSPDCSGTGTQLKDYIPIGDACTPLVGDVECPVAGETLQFYSPNGVYSGLVIASAGDNDDDNRVAYGIGFGLGFGIPFVILMSVIYHFYYAANAQQNRQKLRQGPNSSA